MDEKDPVKTAPESRPAAPRAPESRAFQKSGVELLIRFHIVDKIAKIYDIANDAFVTQGGLLYESLAAALADAGDVELRSRHGALMLNGVRLKFGVGTYGIFKSVLEEFRTRGVEAVVFKAGLDRDELLRFMSVFAKRDKKDESGFARLEADLDAAGVVHVDTEKITAEEAVQGLHQNAARMFFLSIVHLKESFARDQRNATSTRSTTPSTSVSSRRPSAAAWG
ncbi:MAG: hypothetical protein MUE80_09455 [Acidobacteria bacterium]|nr:hypothetical protein [Acidobacteriota bacterium]